MCEEWGGDREVFGCMVFKKIIIFRIFFFRRRSIGDSFIVFGVVLK